MGLPISHSSYRWSRQVRPSDRWSICQVQIKWKFCFCQIHSKPIINHLFIRSFLHYPCCIKNIFCFKVSQESWAKVWNQSWNIIKVQKWLSPIKNRPQKMHWSNEKVQPWNYFSNCKTKTFQLQVNWRQESIHS